MSERATTDELQAAHTKVTAAIDGLSLDDAERVINGVVLLVYRARRAAARGVMFDAAALPESDRSDV